MSRFPRLVVVCGFLLVSLGLVVPVSSASCASPRLQVAGQEAEGRPRLPVTGPFGVKGSGFVDGCNDGGGGTGCHAQKPEPVRPVRAKLELRQGARTWVIGLARPGSAQHLGDLWWEVALPAGVRPGVATLLTDPPGEELVIDVTRGDAEAAGDAA